MTITKTLIDKAVEMCGSQRRLAHSLGVTPQLVTDWKNEKALPSEAAVGHMALMTGVHIKDALQARAEDALARSPEGQEVLKALRGGSLRGEVAISCIFATLAGSVMYQILIDRIYIVSSRMTALVCRIEIARLRIRIQKYPFFRTRIRLGLIGQ